MSAERQIITSACAEPQQRLGAEPLVGVMRVQPPEAEKLNCIHTSCRRSLLSDYVYVVNNQLHCVAEKTCRFIFSLYLSCLLIFFIMLYIWKQE